MLSTCSYFTAVKFIIFPLILKLNITFSFSVLPPVLVPRQSEFPRPPGPMPYHMQHMSSVHGMPGNAGFPPSFQRPTPGPGIKILCTSDKSV